MNSPTDQSNSPTEAELELARKLINKCVGELQIPETRDGVKMVFPEGVDEFPPEGLMALRIRDAAGNYYALGFRFFDEDRIKIAETVYDPLSGMLGFLRYAKDFWSDKISEPDMEEFVTEGAEWMFHSMLYRLHPTLLDFMGNLSVGVYHDWAQRQVQRLERYYSKKGQTVKFDHKRIAKDQAAYLKEQQAYIRNLFALSRKRSDVPSAEDKKQFALKYREVLPHWEKASRVFADGLYDWRSYLNSGRETPADLLDNLKHGKTYSALALEHAARLAGIFKTDSNEKIRELRQQRISASGYAKARLYDFVREGERLLAEDESKGEAFQQL
ncbi:MAG TPA: hypothetical protein VLL54_16430 [Pyrinomonadaceae bacterium]|nr:hypothetical protein [Pyrinomonadaceae bacterium]